MTERLQAAVRAVLDGDYEFCARAVRTGVTYPPDPNVRGGDWRKLISRPALSELFAAAEEAGFWSEPPADGS